MTTTPTSVRGRSQIDRRAIYKRSNTMSTLPVGSLPVTADRSRLAPIRDSSIDETLPGNLTNSSLQSPPDHHVVQRVSDGGIGGAGGGSKIGVTASSRRSTFVRKASCNDLLLTGYNPNVFIGGLPGSDVIPTGSSLLAKVRDRIRETVLSTEWNAAVVLQERHHRAAEQLEAAARCRLQQQTGNGSKRLSPIEPADSFDNQHQHQQHQPWHHSPTNRMAATSSDNTVSERTHRTSSNTAVNSSRRESARIGFRRRSISCEDAYASTTTPLANSAGRVAASRVNSGGSGISLPLHSTSKGSSEAITSSTNSNLARIGVTQPVKSRSSGRLHADECKKRVGVICSKEDFKSLIVDAVGRQKTPSPSGDTTSRSIVGSRQTSPSHRPLSKTMSVSRRVGRQSTSITTQELARDVDDERRRRSSLRIRSSTSLVQSEPETATVFNFRLPKPFAFQNPFDDTKLKPMSTSQQHPTKKMTSLCDPDDNEYGPRSSAAIDAGPGDESLPTCGDEIVSLRRRESVVPLEVQFDNNGQTWDVYGAELDPEILGSAIQSHLERIMTSFTKNTSGLAYGGVADDANEDCIVALDDDVDRTADFENHETEGGSEYWCDKKLKQIDRKQVVFGVTSEPDHLDDENRRANSTRQKGLLRRIACLLTKRKQKRLNESRF